MIDEPASIVMQGAVPVTAAPEDRVAAVTEVVMTGGGQREPFTGFLDRRFEEITPGQAAVMLPGPVECSERSRYGNGPGADDGFDAAAVVQPDARLSEPAFVATKSRPGYGMVSVDRERLVLAAG